MSHAVWRHGLSSTPSLTPRMPASSNSRWSELPVPSSRCQSTSTSCAARGGQQLALDAPPRRARRASAAGTARRGRPRRARARSAAAARHDPRAAPARRGGPASPCRSAPRRRWRRATPRTAARARRSRPAPAPPARRRPEALSSAPGDGGTVSACAISTRTQSRVPGHTPITLRDRPRGVAKRCTRTSRPAFSKRSPTRRCARRSNAPAAGRGAVARDRDREVARRSPGAPAPPPPARRSRSEGAAPAQHRGHGLEQDRQVEADRPALEVQEVEPHEVVEVELRAARRPATGR